MATLRDWDGGWDGAGGTVTFPSLLLPVSVDLVSALLLLLLLLLCSGVG